MRNPMLSNHAESVKRPYVLRGTGGVKLMATAASAIDAFAEIYEALSPIRMRGTRIYSDQVRGSCVLRQDGELFSFNYTIEPMESTTILENATIQLLAIDQYPTAIAQNDQWTADIERLLLDLQKEQAVVDAQLQSEIAQDSSLTNDTKRKAALTERRAKGRYAEIQEKIEDFHRQKADIAITRARLLREFEVAKLQYERETALIKATAA